MHNLNYNMDGKHWAEEFMSLFGGERRSEIDESLMLAWFCNAIMTGYDVGRSKYRKEIGCNDPAAFVAKVREVADQYVRCARHTPFDLCHAIDELAALLPPETAP